MLTIVHSIHCKNGDWEGSRMTYIKGTEAATGSAL